VGWGRRTRRSARACHPPRTSRPSGCHRRSRSAQPAGAPAGAERDVIPGLPSPRTCRDCRQFSCPFGSARRELQGFKADVECCTDERSLLVALGNALPFPTITARTGRRLKTASATWFGSKPERRLFSWLELTGCCAQTCTHSCVACIFCLTSSQTSSARTPKAFSSRSSLSVSWMRPSRERCEARVWEWGGELAADAYVFAADEAGDGHCGWTR
jgi:hypothetical protein